MSERCKTEHPVLLVHGVGLRDWKYFNYWGRIPNALEREGAAVYYGNQDSLGSVEYNGEILQKNIEKLLSETGHEKVNIIAHSKGGLEARYMISSLGMSEKVASLTTVATPHRGSKTVDLFLKLPRVFFKVAAFFANIAGRCLGDKTPDFYAVSIHLSTEHLTEFNRRNPDADSVYYQSYGAVMRNAFSDIIFFCSHIIVYLIEGKNDGIVSLESSKWTNFKGVFRGAANRGISHADVIDVRRWSVKIKNSSHGTTDIVDTYITIVEGLKGMGF